MAEARVELFFVGYLRIMFDREQGLEFTGEDNSTNSSKAKKLWRILFEASVERVSSAYSVYLISGDQDRHLRWQPKDIGVQITE